MRKNVTHKHGEFYRAVRFDVNQSTAVFPSFLRVSEIIGHLPSGFTVTNTPHNNLQPIEKQRFDCPDQVGFGV
ncbi:MAG: hypothetical protein HQ504_11070 [Rhodospirillaceae bacterium]|nr:hypothetical protein [Rhodospirillaceae bacterium]